MLVSITDMSISFIILEIVEMIEDEKELERTFPITREWFRTWLESKSEEEIIGLTDSPASCPIANALRNCDLKFNEVFADYGEVRLNDWITLENPQWVNYFMIEIDSLGIGEIEITVKEAVEALDRVDKEL